MEHTGTLYESLTFREHVRLRPNSYIGSKNPTENTQWVINCDYELNNIKLEKQTLPYPTALYNICDEIILNAIDHCLRTKKLKGKGKCNTIKLSLDKNNGEITCFNNGEGIVAEKNSDGQYIVEMIFTKEMSGSNFSNDEEEKIGANGIGSKATNIMSSVFSVCTYDEKNKIHYNQTFTDGNSIINPPELKKGKKADIPYTQIKFIPDYEYFNYKNRNEIEKIMDIMETLLMTRMYYVSTYLGKDYNVFYNEKKIDICSLEDLAKLAIGEENSHNMVKCNLKSNVSKEKSYEVIISLWDCENNTEHISFINGLYLSEGGTHIKYIIKHVLEAVKPKLEKKLKDKIKVSSKLISNFMFVFFKGDMGKLDYKNQTKNELLISETRFKEFVMDKKSITALWSLLEVKIDELYMNKITKETTTKKTNNLTGIKKYTSADYAGTAKSNMCTLFIPEGDSAESCVRNGLSGNKDLGFKTNGLFNIQGVPLNARKEIDIREYKKNVNGNIMMEKVIDKKKKLDDNERLNSLIKVLNLNWHYKYSNDEEGNKEFATLRYGKVVIAVDADSDGIGCICSLILNFFNLFYPELIKRKYISILNTPLVRAYPTKKSLNGKKMYIEEFYTSEDYNVWSQTVDLNNYKVSYIKGLATHSNAEIKHMFKDMYSKINPFTHDVETDESFEIYFGKDSDKRKTVLSRELNLENGINHYKKLGEIPCSIQLNINTRDYQLENIQRKMPHVIDGLNPARRKVLCGSIYKFKQSNSKIKVFQLGGFIAEKMLYHHGSDSLNNTIITMAQSFIGARNIPILLPIGQFGTHYKGGKDAGSSRYIDTKLNKEVVELLYPSKDLDLLEWTEIDGEIGEPKYFIPILPTGIMEDVLLPSTGWKIEIWARDFTSIYNNVIKLIDKEEEDFLELEEMKYFKNRFDGDEIIINEDDRNTIYESVLVSKYSLNEKKDGDYLTIKSLPPRVWIDSYIESIQSVEGIVRIRNNSTINNVEIEIKINKGILNEMKKIFNNAKDAKEFKNHIDYIHYNFKLYSKLSHCINMYSETDTVLEYKNYKDILLRWFVVRRNCYIKRVERECIILKYKILICENYIRFIQNHETYNLSKSSEKEADVILEKNNYQKLNKTIIECAGRIPNEDLEDHILNKDSNYNYLMNLSYRQMNSDCLVKLQKKLKDLIKELKELSKKDSYKSIWKKELEALKPILLKGFANGFYKEDETLFK